MSTLEGVCKADGWETVVLLIKREDVNIKAKFTGGDFSRH
jgi:hypothetical protein